MKPPVQLTIHDIAFGGAGVARHEGKVWFVPFTAPGDVIRAEALREKKSFVEGAMIELVTPGPSRARPRCAYYTRCGGCAYQHLDYDAQLALKHKQVEQTLRRVGKLTEVPMREITAAPQPYSFRNRIRVHVEGGIAGFYGHGSRELVPIQRCEIAQESVNTALQNLRRKAVQDGDYTLTAGVSGQYFAQTNDAVAEEMLRLTEKEIARDKTLLVDAYCGSGFFAKRLSPLFQQVIGIEENEHAVHHANASAQPNEKFIAGDVAAHLGEILTSRNRADTVVVVDPPATGLAPRVADILAAASPSQLLYISCNPATLARDLALLGKVMRLESVTPIDMFPQTAEIEVLTVLRS